MAGMHYLPWVKFLVLYWFFLEWIMWNCRRRYYVGLIIF